MTTELPDAWDLEPLLGRRFVLQQSEMDHPDAQDSHSVLAHDPGRPGGYLQHYFDSRGVRLCEMSVDGRTWTLTRRIPDFSPLDFAQRFTADLGGDEWRLDFRLTYRRTG